MAGFANAVDQDDWRGHDTYLCQEAAKITALAAAHNDKVDLHYFGLAEVPHIVALGARLGSERAIKLHDYDRDAGEWRWPRTSEPCTLTVLGAETIDRVIKARGPVVLRVALSAAIADSDVRDAVGDETLADITITHQDISPRVGSITSAASVDSVRQVFRRVFAELRNACPHADLVHLFVAAPASVCLAIGQELTLRNAPPVQTYRFRKTMEGTSQRPAILLAAAGESLSLRTLTAAEIAIAKAIREQNWRSALRDIENFAGNKDNAIDGLWSSTHVAASQLQECAAFPNLPSVSAIVATNATTHAEPLTGDYRFEHESRRWHLGDHLLVGLSSAANGDPERLRQLLRLFLFHEYLHMHQGLTTYTAAEIGKFPNCLEYLDYEADAYALLQQWDLMRFTNLQLQPVHIDSVRAFFTDQIDLAIRGFWAFDSAVGDEWQVRRIRRYLNWYWRLIQVQHATSIEGLLSLVSRPPHIEIGGLQQIARGPRVFALLHRRDTTSHLELAIVLEDDTLHRVADSPTTNLQALLDAFRQSDHEELKRFFQAVYDSATPKALQPQTGRRRK